MYLEFLEVKNAYIKASRRAFACGLAAASGGNISARIPGSGYMLIKPSGITLGDADEDNLLITDLEGTVIEGVRKPTKETILHGGIYRKCRAVRLPWRTPGPCAGRSGRGGAG